VDALDLLEFERLTDLGVRALEDDRADEARVTLRAAVTPSKSPCRRRPGGGNARAVRS
jgi:hypothetical protein